MPKIYFDYTNYKGQRDEDRTCEPLAIRFGTSAYHAAPQWLMLGKDLQRGENREYAMRDQSNVRPGFTMYLFTKDSVRQVVTRLEEIARHPQSPTHVKSLAREALKEISRDKTHDTPPDPEPAPEVNGK